MKTTGEVAFFNLERTVVDYVYGNAVDDLSERFGSAPRHGQTEKSTLAGDHQRLLGWLATSREADIDCLLNITAQKTDKRLASWAKLVIGAYAQAGVPLCVYSATLPHNMAKAYASGITTAVPGSEIAFVRGKRQVDGRYQRSEGTVSRKEVFAILEEQGKQPIFMADSFLRSMYTLKEMPGHLLVNPDEVVRGTPRHHSRHQILWTPNQPAQTTFKPADQYKAFDFDLSDPVAQADFMDHLREASAITV